MRYLAHLLLLTLSPLLAFTQTAPQKLPVPAIKKASSQYTNILAGLTSVNSDCEQTLDKPRNSILRIPSLVPVLNRFLGSPARPRTTPLPLTWFQHQRNVAEYIAQANDQIDIAAQNFVPMVPCQTIAAVFNKLQTNILDRNAELRDIACSSSLATQEAAKANAPALRRAISDQILGARFAANKACNKPQTPAQLQSFANAIAAVDADDKKTAQAFSLVGGTLGCLV
ncbi:MAG: hypothetical protein Q9168_003581 [Polycauliona sp. 1 TL-2023]